MNNIADMINQDKLLNLTRTLVEIPSVTGQEQTLSNWTFDYLKSLGLDHVQRLPVEDAGETIVGWLDGPEDGPEMMLMFHLDTFDVCDGWNTDPFKAVLVPDE